jgi:hypothetical protein
MSPVTAALTAERGFASCRPSPIVGSLVSFDLFPDLFPT